MWPVVSEDGPSFFIADFRNFQHNNKKLCTICAFQSYSALACTAQNISASPKRRKTLRNHGQKEQKEQKQMPMLDCLFMHCGSRFDYWHFSSW
ncbi:hypothetical protein D910_07678 [Dendroctonus ponderosae]|uniref:Uncharacterized protein n=1 Tax=Dendroctonus ponderosae TaxID=77166 RepID=U4U8W2_DENPD|nr:hypothetical protein D910_07678 [Dendroctonus ponderosae]